MIKTLLCLIVAAVVGGLISAFWVIFDQDVAGKYLLVPPCAVYGLLWFVLPEERPRRVRRRY